MSNGTQTPQETQKSTWDDQVLDVRDLGVKYINNALNAASGSSGGIVRNQFNFPTAPPAAGPGSTQPPTPAAGFLKTALLAATLGGGAGILGALALNKPAAPTTTTPVVETTPGQSFDSDVTMEVVPPDSQKGTQ